MRDEKLHREEGSTSAAPHPLLMAPTLSKLHETPSMYLTQDDMLLDI